MQFLPKLTLCLASVVFVCLTIPQDAWGFEIFGYVPEYRQESIQWEEAMKYVTTVVLFSVEVSQRGDLVIMDRIPEPDTDLWKRIKSATKTHNTKLLVSVGGVGRAGGISVVVADAGLRKILVDNIMEFVAERSLSGIDFDFDIPRDKEHQEQLGTFFAEMRFALNKQGKILTITVAPGPRQRLPESVLTKTDFVHMMAYDNWCAFPSTALPPCKHSEYQYAIDVISQIKSVPHVRNSMVTLGIPFYGRHVTKGNAMSYWELKERSPNTSAATDVIDEYSFNNKDTVKKKVELAFNKGLGGVMIWEIGQDFAPSHEDALLPLVWNTVQELIVKAQHEEEL